MNYKYILNKIKKANKYAIETYEHLKDYENNYNNKYLLISIENITEINEILTNLEIEIKIKLEEKKDE